MADTVEVIDNQDALRFEARAEGEDEDAVLTYRLRADRLVLTHTEVPAPLEGRGIGGEIRPGPPGPAPPGGAAGLPPCPVPPSLVRPDPDGSPRRPTPLWG